MLFFIPVRMHFAAPYQLQLTYTTIVYLHYFRQDRMILITFLVCMLLITFPLLLKMTITIRFDSAHMPGLRPYY